MNKSVRTKPCGCGPDQVCRECASEVRGQDVTQDVAVDQSTFDPRTEVSADAAHMAQCAREASGRIVMHMWIIFVLLPVVLGILFAIVK